MTQLNPSTISIVDRNSSFARANVFTVASGSPTAAAERGVSIVSQTRDGTYNRLVLQLTNVDITVTDSGGANGGIGSLTLGSLPDGVLHLLPTVEKFTLTSQGAGIGATAIVKHSLGTAAVTGNDTLDSTEANLVASTSATLAASTVTSNATGVAATAGAVGGTNSLVLNVGVADAQITATTPLRFTGTIEIAYCRLAS
jgi:hypothetical protein